MTTTRSHPHDPTLLVVLDDEGRVAARTCRDDGLVHPVSALTTHGRRSRHLCRSCHRARLAARNALLRPERDNRNDERGDRDE